MRIQHNIMAMNAYRNYNTNTSALSKNLEKLSSGYKINRAGDDAAGLAISEKMRAQITGLNAAQKNVKDGISLVKTAEGAMQEIQDMLNRMDYLATQSANGTYDNEVDRANLQKEVDALKSEINRIADSANFNGIKLLDGSLDTTNTTGSTTQISATVIQTQVKGVASSAATAPSFKVDLNGVRVQNTGTATADLSLTVTIGSQSFTFQATGVAAGAIVKASDFVCTATGTQTLGGIEFEVTASGVFTAKASATGSASYKNLTGDDLQKYLNSEFNISVAAGSNSTVLDGSVINNKPTVITTGKLESGGQAAKAEFELTADMVKDGAQLIIGTTTYTIKYDVTGVSGQNIGVKDLLKNGKLSEDDIHLVADRLTEAAAGNTMFSVGATGNTIQVVQKDTAAATADTNQTKTMYTSEDVLKYLGVKTGPGAALTLQIGDTSDGYNQLKLSVGDMHTKALGIDGLDISNPTGAAAAIKTIRNAINSVSSVRGDLGATQNRLEHTANNLSVMAENIQDAESTIRDTDVAEEMMAYTKNNILIQSAQAMLAQANAVPQGVLQLLG